MTAQAPPAVAVPAPRPGEEPTPLDRYRTFTQAVLAKCTGDPGARIALRSGVGKNLDSVPRMHQVIAHLVPQNAPDDTQRAYYAVAAMIAEQARRAPAAAGADDTAPAEETTEPAPSAETDPTGQDSKPGGGRDYGTSLGASFALAVVRSPGHERKMRRGTAESRLNLLCKQGVPGVHRHLPASIRYLRSLDVPVDWARLLQDLIGWQRHSGRITRRWLQDFYRQLLEEERRLRDQGDRQEPEIPDGA
ncbi:type I-E CRISPR-associated protein Cse2/CasB [Streptomyces longwoodensis]|uniref:type I-E CRISPR-associated protein Cse2/CasB n=1 Tax=Streptomyces longwoodensis TaxID=68231 RepID=UPI0036FA864E